MLAISKQIKKYRMERGMTQEELAEQLFISRQAISKWEKGEANPDLDNTVKLAAIFEVSLDDLVLEHKITEENQTHFDHFIYNPNTGEYEKHRVQKMTNFYDFAARFWPLLLILLWGVSHFIYSIIKLFV
ncbi:helix-turn-helix domain-containing protein [Streptococcus merionis]|uniref:helix-turn-helix domain-containing protein n=1 Tax=Streptococcus merionis TaxID=400065 RepID=UPI0026F09150|nr:helix-turn-helix domain-containing protein [Streptococcus merionis]